MKLNFATYFHKIKDENKMTNKINNEQTAMIADVCTDGLFRKFTSKF